MRRLAELAAAPAVTIGPMTFGPARPDLMPGAENAIGTCLAIQSGERVALVADEPSREVAASLEQALRDRGAEIDAVLIEAVATRPIRVAPTPVIEALEMRGCRDPVRPADGRGARRAHGDRLDRRAAPHPLRPHDRGHAARS